jgi:hypothetical protein
MICSEICLSSKTVRLEGRAGLSARCVLNLRLLLEFVWRVLFYFRFPRDRTDIDIKKLLTLL